MRTRGDVVKVRTPFKYGIRKIHSGLFSAIVAEDDKIPSFISFISSP